MTQRAAWIGVVATSAIMFIIFVAAVREPARLVQADAEQRAAALARGMDLYALYCAECHGSRGQGEITEDATKLDDPYMRSRDADWLYKAIQRGREDTEMAAFHLDEGGALNRQQIESLVAVIQYGAWDTVAARVAELGQISPEEVTQASATTQALAFSAEPPRPTRMPTLDPSQPTAMPTRMPTLDPSQPTAMPTRMPTLDPSQPTAMPTRLPTLDPSQPTPAAVLEQAGPPMPAPSDTNSSPPSSEAPVAAEEEQTTAILTSSEDFPYDPPGPHVTDDMSGRRMYKEFCEECHGQQGVGTEDAPGLEALNAIKIAQTVRDGPEDMDVFTHDDIPDRALNALIDYVLLFHPDSEPRQGTVITQPVTR